MTDSPLTDTQLDQPDPLAYGPTGYRCGCGKDAHSNLVPCAPDVDDDRAIQILSNEGAQCGTCGDEPGDRTCPDCERCRSWYVAALRKAGWAPQEEHDALVAEVHRLRAELAEYEVLNPQQCPAGKHADWLVDSEYAHACPWCQIEALKPAPTA